MVLNPALDRDTILDKGRVVFSLSFTYGRLLSYANIIEATRLNAFNMGSGVDFSTV